MEVTETIEAMPNGATQVEARSAERQAAAEHGDDLESRVRLYLAASGVEHEPIVTHTVRRLFDEAQRLRGEVTGEALMKLVIDHHHLQMPVLHPVSPSAARRLMKPRRLRPVFALLGRVARWKMLRWRQACEAMQARHVRPLHE